MRILVEIEYQGNQFLGFQIQQQGRTVQQQFEKILKRMHKRHIRIHPSSRTDRGVHAYQQYFHFDTELQIENSKWQYAMNSALPDDIYVKSVMSMMFLLLMMIFIVDMIVSAKDIDIKFIKLSTEIHFKVE